MKTLVVYDSNFGNTKQVAESIAQVLGAKTVAAAEVKDGDLADAELLVAGCPINAWRPSPRMGDFLKRLKSGQLAGKYAASFDTRVKLFIHGDAATRISRVLSEAGARIITDPAPFYVKGKEGPLLDGELAKAAEWARKIQEKAR